MKCLKCGTENNSLICPQCISDELLEKYYNEMKFFSEEKCEDSALLDFNASLEAGDSVRAHVKDIIDLSTGQMREFLECVWFYDSKKYQDDEMGFVEVAEDYISKYGIQERRSQLVYLYLLRAVKYHYGIAKKYYDFLLDKELVYLDIYVDATEYYSYIGEYDLAHEIGSRARNIAQKGIAKTFWGNEESRLRAVEKYEQKAEDYKKKPYWPSTEERRRKLIPLYDERGIKHPDASAQRIQGSVKTSKIDEKDFERFNADYEIANTYCSFWCAEAKAFFGEPVFYDIAAVKVENGKIIDKYHALVNPKWRWGDKNTMKAAVECSGMDEGSFEKADQVEVAVPKFLAFCEGLQLVSTGALAEQGKLLRRAARYAGMTKIDNPVCDILDVAEDNIDMTGATREKLLERYGLIDGVTALSRAETNVKIIQNLNREN